MKVTRHSWHPWAFDLKIGEWYVEFDPSNITHPRVSWCWQDEGRGAFTFAIGDGSSDDVFGITTCPFLPPRWLLPVVEWFDIESQHARRRRRRARR